MPVGGEGFDVAGVVGVRRVALGGEPELPGQAKRLRIAAGLMEGGEAMDGEGLGVEVLARVGRRALGGDGPEHAPLVRIDQVRGDEAPGPGRRLQQGRIGELHRGPGEEPEDPGLQQGALVGGPKRPAGSARLSGEAPARVAQPQPEGDDAVQLVSRGGRQPGQPVSRGRVPEGHLPAPMAAPIPAYPRRSWSGCKSPGAGSGTAGRPAYATAPLTER